VLGEISQSLRVKKLSQKIKQKRNRWPSKKEGKKNAWPRESARPMKTGEVLSFEKKKGKKKKGLGGMESVLFPQSPRATKAGLLNPSSNSKGGRGGKEKKKTDRLTPVVEKRNEKATLTINLF